MVKQQEMAGNVRDMPTAPPPTAPPSYEEAVANTGAPARPYPMTQPVPYPVSGSPMPMPNPYAQPSMPMPTPMPMPTSMPGPISTGHTSPYPQQYNPQPQVAPQSYPPPTQVQIVQQNTSWALGPHPIKMTCPTCRADIKTATVSDHQPSAHICCMILCLLGCCLCSCLPYCMTAFMSVHHSCPNCKTYIGTWKG